MNFISYYLFFFLFIYSNQEKVPLFIESENIQIARDQWGVPHIYAPTDKEVAYGLGWVQCEDDFVTLQEQLLANKGMLGEIKGKKGIVIDFGIKFMGLREAVEAKYESDLSPEFKAILENFTASINNYAALHPDEVLLKKLFPIIPEDVVVGYLLALVELTGARVQLEKIFKEEIEPLPESNIPKGSNAIAVSRQNTTDGKTYLAINSHQPLEGWYSWYEVHLMSDEGLNILGGTFPLGVSVLHGTNNYLGWAHTVNHPDLTDVYQLKMHPQKKEYYRFDGQWLRLKKRTYKAKLKFLGGIKIPIKRSIYYSVYGPTFETKMGFFALRAVAALDVRAAENWYLLNKTKNLQEFREVLEMQGLTSMNIVYADREDNILFLSNGRFPVRDPNYDWQNVLSGDTSATLWPETYYPIDSLPQLLNPSSGYIFNTNNTPFSATNITSDNPSSASVPFTMGFKKLGLENNRSLRLLELINQIEGKINYEDFKAIKFDIQYPAKLMHHEIINLELILSLDPAKHPDIADGIKLLKSWDRIADSDSQEAPLFILATNNLNAKLIGEGRLKAGGKATEEDCAYSIKKAKEELLKKYGSIKVPLKDFQRLIRGEVNLPVEGGPDLLRAIYCFPTKDNQYCKGMAGDSYIELVRFSPEGVEIESIHSYGSSARKNSPHFTDQMEYFTQNKLKKMSLDKDQVFKNAALIYAPKNNGSELRSCLDLASKERLNNIDQALKALFLVFLTLVQES